MYNRCFLLGNLGRDPEVFKAKNGSSFVRFSLATKSFFKNQSTGTSEGRTEWHRVISFTPGSVSYATKYLSSGSLVFVEGRITYSKYDDKKGITRYSTDILAFSIQGLDRSGKSLENDFGTANQDYSESLSKKEGSGVKSHVNEKEKYDYALDEDVPF